MNSNSNRLFSSFLNPSEMEEVTFISYFACRRDENSLQLLPSDHCLYYPLKFDTSTRHIYHGELNFFNRVLFEKFKPENIISETKVALSKLQKKQKKALIINLIDNCYGHSFLKLLNLYNIYELFSAQFDLWVITPTAIKHFVPDAKFYVAEVSLGFNDAMNCYFLNPVVNKIKENYEAIDYVTLDTYSNYQNKIELKKFFPFTVKDLASQKKYITFYYRSDYFRTWGGSSQAKLISDFFKQLRTYFDKEVEFVILGDKDSHKFTNDVIDKRTNEFGKEIDQEYNGVFSRSYMVIGLIGSNMLQPSMFCDFTIHLVPRSKVTIVAEELFNITDSAIQNWFNNIYIFGNENLGDIKAGNLVEKVMLLYQTYLAKLYKKEIYADENFTSRISQSEFISKNFPFYKATEAIALKQKVTDTSFSYNLWRYRFYNFFKKIRRIK